MAEQILVEKRADGVVWVTIDRPDVHNALNGAVLEGLKAAAQRLGADDAVRAVVFTGAGPKTFCAGADLKERQGMSEAETVARIDLIGSVFSSIARLPKPTIAALNGSAYGGGLELAIACDFRVAVSGCELGLTEVRLGILPGAGGTQRLPRLIGVARAKQMILLGERISAETALAFGLVSAVVAPSELAAAVRALTDKLAGCAPLGVALAKRAIDDGMDVDLARGLGVERACYDLTRKTEDRNEGLRAFAEKRPPRYQGK